MSLVYIRPCYSLNWLLRNRLFCFGRLQAQANALRKNCVPVLGDKTIVASYQVKRARLHCYNMLALQGHYSHFVFLGFRPEAQTVMGLVIPREVIFLNEVDFRVKNRLSAPELYFCYRVQYRYITL